MKENTSNPKEKTYLDLMVLFQPTDITPSNDRSKIKKLLFKTGSKLLINRPTARSGEMSDTYSEAYVNAQNQNSSKLPVAKLIRIIKISGVKTPTTKNPTLE